MIHSSHVLIGAHESIAGGVDRAFERGRADGCAAMQIFTRNSGQWRARPLPDDEVARFRRHAKEAGWPLLAHGSYLLNPATPDKELRDKSIASLVEELERCEALGLDYLVIHPGAHMGEGMAAGVRRVAAALGAVHRRTRGFHARILIEITAGQGTCIGARFDEVAALCERAGEGERLGVCFDTCHAHAAGYDLATAEGYDRTWEEFDRVIGFSRLSALHLNDCKKPLGCRVDRHAHIGEGTIGMGCFVRLMNDPRFAGLPAVLETPLEKDETYGREVALLRGLQEPRRGERADAGEGERARGRR